MRLSSVRGHILAHRHRSNLRRRPSWHDCLADSCTFAFLQHYACLFEPQLRPIARLAADVWLSLPEEMRARFSCEEDLSGADVSDLASIFHLLHPGSRVPGFLAAPLDDLCRLANLMELSLAAFLRATRKEIAAGRMETKKSMCGLIQQSVDLFMEEGTLVVSDGSCWCSACEAFV